MNAYRTTRCSTFLILGVLGCAVSAGDGRAKDGSSDLQLKVNDEHFPVFFQDSTLTDTEERAIVADYQVLLQELAPPVGRYPFRRGQIQRDGTTITLTRIFGFSEKHLKRPEGYEQELGIIGTSSDSREYIVIRKELSDGYKAALALKKAHEEACGSLPQFVALLNDLTETQMPAVEDFFYLHGEMKKRSEAFATTPKQKIIAAYGGFRYTCVSMLELRMFEGKLTALVYASNRNAGRIYNRPVIYDDGRWKVFVARTE